MRVSNGIQYRFASFDLEFFNSEFYFHLLAIEAVTGMRIIDPIHFIPIQNILADIGFSPGDMLVEADHDARKSGNTYTIGIKVGRSELGLEPDGWQR